MNGSKKAAAEKAAATKADLPLSGTTTKVSTWRSPWQRQGGPPNQGNEQGRAHGRLFGPAGAAILVSAIRMLWELTLRSSP